MPKEQPFQGFPPPLAKPYGPMDGYQYPTYPKPSFNR